MRSRPTDKEVLLHTVVKIEGVSGRLSSLTRPDQDQIRGNGAGCSASLQLGLVPTPLPSREGPRRDWPLGTKISSATAGFVEQHQICVLQRTTYGVLLAQKRAQRGFHIQSNMALRTTPYSTRRICSQLRPSIIILRVTAPKHRRSPMTMGPNKLQ